MAGALKAIKALNFGKDKRVVVLLADSIRNYMSKHLNDDWMKKNGFVDDATKKVEEERIESFGGATIEDLELPVPVCVSEMVRHF